MPDVMKKQREARRKIIRRRNSTTASEQPDCLSEQPRSPPTRLHVFMGLGCVKTRRRSIAIEEIYSSKTAFGRTVGAGSSGSTFPLTFKAQILREAAVEAAFLLHRNRPLRSPHGVKLKNPASPSKVSPLALDTQRRPTHVSSSYLARAIDVQRARSFRADEHVAIAIP
jgi:hypothetical protein